MLVRQGAVFHFRRAVPRRIRPLFGRAELWCSLRTYQERTARALAGVLYAASEQAFEVAMFAVELMDAGAEERALLLGIEDEARQLLAVEEALVATRDRVAELRRLMSEARSAEAQRAVLERATAKLRTVERGVYALGGQLAEARRTGDGARAMAADLARLAERKVAAPAPAAPAPAEPPAKKASELVEEHFENRRAIHDATHQVIGQERTTIRLFLECCGDRPFDAYKRGDVTGFLKKLRRMPATYGKSPKDADLSMEQLIKRADDQERESGGKEPVKRLSDKTVKRHLSALSQFLQFAVNADQLSQSRKLDLVNEHDFRTDEAARDQREAWTPEEMKTLFSSPVWTGCRSRTARSEPGDW